MPIEIFSLYLVGLLGALIPGPDIIYIIRTTLHSGKNAGFISAFGVLFASLFYLLIVAFGLKNIGTNPYFQIFIGIFGSIYLIWISIGIWNASLHLEKNKTINYKPSYLFFKGILIHLSNPKVIIFFSVILAPFLQSNTIIQQIAVLTLGHMTSFFGTILIMSRIGNYITTKKVHLVNRLSAFLFLFFAVELFKNAYTATKQLYF